MHFRTNYSFRNIIRIFSVLRLICYIIALLLKMEMQDCCGNVLTCSNQEALSLYNEVLEALLSQKEGFIESLRRAIKLDENFVLAHCLMVILIF